MRKVRQNEDYEMRMEKNIYKTAAAYMAEKVILQGGCHAVVMSKVRKLWERGEYLIAYNRGQGGCEGLRSALGKIAWVARLQLKEQKD